MKAPTLPPFALRLSKGRNSLIALHSKKSAGLRQAQSERVGELAVHLSGTEV